MRISASFSFLQIYNFKQRGRPPRRAAITAFLLWNNIEINGSVFSYCKQFLLSSHSHSIFIFKVSLNASNLHYNTCNFTFFCWENLAKLFDSKHTIRNKILSHAARRRLPDRSVYQQSLLQRPHRLLRNTTRILSYRSIFFQHTALHPCI